jgi:HD-GYP domain-containing protein (c-di-GMP phosphodiesterase class II)
MIRELIAGMLAQEESKMRRKIGVEHLAAGMFVDELDRPWEGTPFLFQGIYLETPEAITTLQNLCGHVYIDTAKGVDLPFSLQTGPCPTRDDAFDFQKPLPRRRRTAVPTRRASSYHATGTTPFPEEIERVREIRHDTEILIDNMHDDVKQGRQINAKRSELIVGDMVESIARNPNALIWMTHLKDRDKYTALHSMNVCALSLMLGHYIGLERRVLNQLGLSALLHDIGKLKVPLDVLNKPDRLTPKEFQLMQQHPSHGLNILLDTPKLPRNVLDVVHSHHERVSGGGYPRGIGRDEISFFSRLTSIVDVYDALTSDRVYRDSMPSHNALKILYSERGRNFDAVLVEQFIRCVGTFPSGSLVELKTGEVGVVLRPQGQRSLKPIVTLLLDRFKKRYYPLKIVDYNLVENQSSEYGIKRALPAGRYGINPIEFARDISTELKNQTDSEL